MKWILRQKRYFIGPQQILNSLNQFRPFFVKISVLSVLVSVFDSNHRIDVAMEQGNPRKTRYSFEKVLTLPVKLHQRFIVLKASLPVFDVCRLGDFGQSRFSGAGHDAQRALFVARVPEPQLITRFCFLKQSTDCGSRLAPITAIPSNIGTVPGAVATGRLAKKAFRWGHPVATAPGTVPPRVPMLLALI